MLIMELPVGAKKEKKEVALNNLSAIMDKWGATNIIITTTITIVIIITRKITISKPSGIGGGQNFTNPINTTTITIVIVIFITRRIIVIKAITDGWLKNIKCVTTIKGTAIVTNLIAIVVIL